MTYEEFKSLITQFRQIFDMLPEGMYTISKKEDGKIQIASGNFIYYRDETEWNIWHLGDSLDIVEKGVANDPVCNVNADGRS